MAGEANQTGPGGGNSVPPGSHQAGATGSNAAGNPGEQVLRDTGYTPETLPAELKPVYDNMIRGMNAGFQKNAEDLKAGREAMQQVSEIYRPLFGDPVIRNRVEFLQRQQERLDQGLPPLQDDNIRQSTPSNPGNQETAEGEIDPDAPLTLRNVAKALGPVIEQRVQAVFGAREQKDFMRKGEEAVETLKREVGEEEYSANHDQFVRQLQKYKGSQFSPLERARKAWQDVTGQETEGQPAEEARQETEQTFGAGPSRLRGTRRNNLPPRPPRNASPEEQRRYAIGAANIIHGVQQ